MISFWDLSRALQTEWHRMEKEDLQTDCIRGMIQGLKLASVIAKEVRDRAKDHPSKNPGGHRKSYYEAIVTAHSQLKSYERSHALQTLEKVIDRVKAEAQAVAL